MPIIDGIGYSPATPYKQFALNGALGHLLGTSVSVAENQRFPAPCIICDMTSGPGVDPYGNDGSPTIIARHLEGFRQRGHTVTLICVDSNLAFLERLHSLLDTRYPHLTVEYFDDQAAALARIPRHAVGLTYWDPNGYNELDRDLLSEFGRSHARMDILITRECLAGYRMQRAAHCPGTLTIQDYLALTGKRCNYIMQYAKHGWWSLGFADNWEDRPPRKLRGFCNVESAEGRRLYAKWTNAAPPNQDEEPPEEEQTLWGA